MTDKLKAQVSAFVDDELLEAESELLIRRLCSDAELRKVAARYTLIGDAIRGSLHEIRADLAGNIMQVIENEALEESVAQKGAPRWPRALGGGLVAAAVAAVAVFSLQPAETPDSAPPIAVVVPEDNPAPDVFQPDGVPAAVRQASNQSQLDRYLLRHNQFATNTGRQQVLIYRSMGKASTPQQDAGSDGETSGTSTPPEKQTDQQP